MFWAGILITALLVIGASVLIGKMLDGRGKRGRKLTKQEQVNYAKAAGAFPQRKESDHH